MITNNDNILGKISFRQLEAFLLVAKCRSVIKASGSLNMTQSGLSRVIATLEKEVGEPLFSRRPAGLVLTPTGEELLPYARSIVAHYRTLQHASITEIQGSLRIACTDFLLPDLLDAGAVGTHHAGPTSSTPLIVSAADLAVSEMVAAGEADCGLCLTDGDSPGLYCLPLLRAPLGLLTRAARGVAIPHHHLQTDLAPLPMARLTDTLLLPQVLRRSGVQLDIYFHASVVADHEPTLIQAVALGSVSTITSAFAASMKMAHPLQFTALPDLLPSIQLCLICRADLQDVIRKEDEVVALCRHVLAREWLPDVTRVSTDRAI